MVVGKHYSPQLQQERISRHQLSERLTAFGWKPIADEPDLGEDLVVDVYLNGRATGITFYVQLKIVRSLDALRSGEHLVFDLEIKDLLHGEYFSLPVALIVWDVHSRQGRWALITDLIADLDLRRPNWRGNTMTARIRLPWNHTTDDDGLRRMRRRLGRHVYPLLAQNRPGRWTLQLQFVENAEGNAAAQALGQLITRGDPATTSQADRLLEALCIIQDRTDIMLRIPSTGIAPDDALRIEELCALVTHGKLARRGGTATVTVPRQGVEALVQLDQGDQPVTTVEEFATSSVEILGTHIDTGPVIRRITGIIDTSPEVMRAFLGRATDDAVMTVVLRDLDVVQFYPERHRREAMRLAKLLYERFDVRHVILFGSVAWAPLAMVRGDIDLAVEGLPAERFLEAVAFMDRHSTFDVDLVDIATLPRKFADRIRTQGQPL